MRFVCARDRHGRTGHGRERASAATHGRHAPREAMTTLRRRRATRKKQRARDDTQICHGSSGTEETPSVIHACIYTNTKVHQCPISPVIRPAPAAARSYVRSAASNQESRMASTRVHSTVGKSRLRHTHVRRGRARRLQTARSVRLGYGMHTARASLDTTGFPSSTS